ncbi:MAG TPA: glycogen-binding domain-containing protein, partial [Armatimonadota bacterium]|nr:glycogen-binding domain-containing protein [Armatimonadota bacterium]
MKRFILPAILLAATILTEPARANGGYYVAGDFNGWNPAGLAMTDVGGGYWEVELPTNVEPGRHEFKVTKGSW